MGPRRGYRAAFCTQDVSALSGESILGPRTQARARYPVSNVFQHSLVSLFWGHLSSQKKFTALHLDVSALSGESILGPHEKIHELAAVYQCFSTL